MTPDPGPPSPQAVVPLYALSLGGLALCFAMAVLPLVGGIDVDGLTPVAFMGGALLLMGNLWLTARLMHGCGALAAHVENRLAIRPIAATDDPVRRLFRAVNRLGEALGAAESEVERLNHADPLTGLGNRRWLQLVASRAFARAEEARWPIALLLVRLDHLQDINQAFGHEAGDRALLGCADLLTRLVRRSDVVARVNGSEFAVLLAGLDQAETAKIARRLSEAFDGMRQALLEEAPLSVRVATTHWEGEKPFESFLGRAQSAADRLPSGPPPLGRAGDWTRAGALNDALLTAVRAAPSADRR